MFVDVLKNVIILYLIENNQLSKTIQNLTNLEKKKQLEILSTQIKVFDCILNKQQDEINENIKKEAAAIKIQKIFKRFITPKKKYKSLLENNSAKKIQLWYRYNKKIKNDKIRFNMKKNVFYGLIFKYLQKKKKKNNLSVAKNAEKNNFHHNILKEIAKIIIPDKKIINISIFKNSPWINDGSALFCKKYIENVSDISFLFDIQKKEYINNKSNLFYEVDCLLNTSNFDIILNLLKKIKNLKKEIYILSRGFNIFNIKQFENISKYATKYFYYDIEDKINIEDIYKFKKKINNIVVVKQNKEINHINFKTIYPSPGKKLCFNKNPKKIIKQTIKVGIFGTICKNYNYDKLLEIILQLASNNQFIEFYIIYGKIRKNINKENIENNLSKLNKLKNCVILQGLTPEEMESYYHKINLSIFTKKDIVTDSNNLCYQISTRFIDLVFRNIPFIFYNQNKIESNWINDDYPLLIDEISYKNTLNKILYYQKNEVSLEKYIKKNFYNKYSLENMIKNFKYTILFRNSDLDNAKKWISKMNGFKPICDKNKILVVMCFYKRLINIEKTLKSLKKQNKSINLCIWNNNFDKKDEIEKELKKYNYENIDINIYHSPENIRGIGRFVMTHYICKYINDYENVFFIDDDQYLNENFINTFLNKYKKYENAAIFWFGKIFNPEVIQNHKNPYWHPQSLNMLSNEKIPLCFEEITNQKNIIDEIYNVDYGGTCGCIYPGYIFKDLDIFNFNIKYRHVEDLTLSYLFKYKYNGKLIVDRKQNKLITAIEDVDKSIAQYRKLIDLKNELLKELYYYYC